MKLLPKAKRTHIDIRLRFTTIRNKMQCLFHISWTRNNPHEFSQNVFDDLLLTGCILYWVQIYGKIKKYVIRWNMPSLGIQVLSAAVKTAYYNLYWDNIWMWRNCFELRNNFLIKHHYKLSKVVVWYKIIIIIINKSFW